MISPLGVPVFCADTLAAFRRSSLGRPAQSTPLRPLRQASLRRSEHEPHANTYTHTYTCKHLYTSIHMYICTYIHIYIYTHRHTYQCLHMQVIRLAVSWWPVNVWIFLYHIYMTSSFLLRMKTNASLRNIFAPVARFPCSATTRRLY